jgi:small subunit ribosomal protein S11
MKASIYNISYPVQRQRKKFRKGIVHIRASFNNTIITVSTLGGIVVSWSSTGACGFRGTRKRTPFASKVATENAIRKRLAQGIQEVRIYIWGPGAGREIAIRAVYDIGLRIVLIRDITTLPHNGCRSPKRRWVLKFENLVKNISICK